MKRLVLIAMVATLFSCQGDARPEGILGREEFKEALFDAQLIEARMNHELVLEQMEAMPVEQYYDEMFLHHETTKEQFKESFDYYSQHPDSLKLIYEEIIMELTLRKDNAAQ